MAKKKENTPEEKKKIKIIAILCLFVIPLCICSVLLWFHFVESPDMSYSQEQQDIIERTKWNMIIPGSRWQLSETNADKNLLPSVLKECKAVYFSQDAKTAEIETKNAKIEGDFTMTGPNTGELTIMRQKFKVRYSDQSKQLFDSNNYMMRITYQDIGSLELFLQPN